MSSKLIRQLLPRSSSSSPVLGSFLRDPATILWYTKQAEAVKEYGHGPHLPGLLLSCSKELMQVQRMTPQVWPNWHSIGYDDTCLLMPAWCSKIVAWEALGNYTFDLLVVAGLQPFTNPTSKSWEKGKGKAVVPDLEPEVEGSWKRKSPMILALPSKPPKSTMKTWKQMKTIGLAKFKVFVESEDDKDSVTQLISRGVVEVVLPQLSTDVARTSRSPQSPQSPKKKKPFGPATYRLAGIDMRLAGGYQLPGPHQPHWPQSRQAVHVDLVLARYACIMPLTGMASTHTYGPAGLMCGISAGQAFLDHATGQHGIYAHIQASWPHVWNQCWLGMP
ncbi:uncharacterized protein EDB93DRAFT_1108874 [Suillus bovinus]|uniref:uncharacterized protein n=1 Tax=Suillus bovinus TaxID=48563 RepID=UPI001B87C92D|nr:uncharacterized protein EDB93DRAFT_1108874 [Suillus bovinus]KAG2128917.1 hypothetical protein EDB93DRAFT_1108874 [Suillus bovinus]